MNFFLQLLSFYNSVSTLLLTSHHQHIITGTWFGTQKFPIEFYKALQFQYNYISHSIDQSPELNVIVDLIKLISMSGNVSRKVTTTRSKMYIYFQAKQNNYSTSTKSFTS
ncbi:hypothetical protein CHS0354_032001 [Potamilus streckersoni]|uniref:Maturase K n=1 Tax=Potamilus streckersoni TaxID=2493646 RepID=A0AAE0TLB3_9BIVA|nr:hypothetical protein CHS0354_032001 [Potamilus streckersoni]